MNTPGRTTVADPDSRALCLSPPSLPSRIARQKLSSCISRACACQKIILSSQIALERLRGIARVHCRYHCAGPRRNTIHVSRWSTVILNQDCSVTFPDESAASGTEGYSLPCLWLVLLSWPAWPTGRAGMCSWGPASLWNVAALRSLCLQGSISQSSQVPALSQWRHPSSSSCISGNCVHWRISSVLLQQLLLEGKSLVLSRGQVMLCAEVSEHSRGCSFLEGVSHWFILEDSKLDKRECYCLKTLIVLKHIILPSEHPSGNYSLFYYNTVFIYLTG